ncbi:MAG: DUF3791 domain-containing protein [Lachnospiraceae bacterium]|jgi:hypothetical protein|uniref:DUF3791 domain-containing protein n=1 Tax=Oribacterium sp. WCC10 TaxID=1855343 RepID=UPI0008E28FC4|nr:DUF3791 domain-containing protein [Oribacterium sp. WCC10]MBE6004634.1 DUF3791 domain-containing protein [Lachnospiraceae bacterium]MCR5007620.1 DUF3791 domain-containing protein [Oribacterium sp.]SFG75961.1 Protein of unknown function [Oribacterium sp. WCC10]
MINEVLYMEIRLVGAFSEKYKLTRSAVNRIFSKYNIWQYIESCYEVFHLNGDEYNLDDISDYLKGKGVVL